ncbi:MAG: DUF3347 domain-containing protein [Flavobacterium sp.]
MKKSITTILVAITILLSFTSCTSQIKNATTETVKIYGNCEMCEEVIEKAGNLKNIAKVDWDKDTKMATLTYDTKKTNQDVILKRIALAGYDSDKFLAPDDVYHNLPECCQYTRTAKVPVKAVVMTENHTTNATTDVQDTNPLKAVFDHYFAVKDALVKTDGALASAKSKGLLDAINAVQMDKLQMDVHMVWMKVLVGLKEDASHIADTKDVKHQRDYFMTLSKHMYTLMKASKQESETFYQFCPMANGGKGANWLSKERAIKNPYFGSKMMTCGNTVETIK